MSNIKYQRIAIRFTAQNTPVLIDAETDKLFAKAKEVAVIAGTSFNTNRNLVFTKPFRVNGNDIYPDGFDTFLLFPRVEHKDYMKIDEKAAGSKVEGEIVDKNAGAYPYTATIIVTLVNESE